MNKRTDPMEIIIEDALIEGGYSYVTEENNPTNLDFNLPAIGVDIEVKRFHTSRLQKQLDRAKQHDQENVIVAVGKPAVEFLALLLKS